MAYTTAGLPLQPAHHAAPARPTQRPVMSATLSGQTAGGPGVPSPGTSCCQTGRPVMTDPVTGQTVCSCQLTPSLAVSYPRLAALPETLYGSAAAYSAQALYAAAAASNGTPPETSPLYAPFGTMSPYELKDAAEVYRGLAQTPTGLLAYDPTAMFTYPFGAGYGSMDLSAARRNKNATRETTSTLKAWLYEHRKNPYPTKGEKIMLAIITKMTLTQVSTWFANARRRLKKDNKMTWTPKNGSGAESDNDDDDTNNNDHRDADDKELDVGSTSDNANQEDTDHHRLDDSRDSIDIDTLSDKDPSESLRDVDGNDDAGRLRASPSDGDHHHQHSKDHHHHPHHHHHHHHHHSTTTTSSSADHLRHSQQQRTDHDSSPVSGGGGGPPRIPPYTPTSSMAALQRTQTGPYHMPYPTSMAHRMALPPTLTSAPELPGLRPSHHAFASPTSSSSASSSSSPFSCPTTATTTARSTIPSDATTTTTSTNKDSVNNNNNNTSKPKIWSLADIVTSSSSSGNSDVPSSITSSMQQVKTPPVRPSPGGAPLPPSALGSLRAWTEATAGPYGLAAAMAAAQGLSHPYARPPQPPHGIPTLPAGFPGLPGGIPPGLAGGIPLMPHQNGFYSPRPADRLNMNDGFRSDSPSSSEENKTAFKPVAKSKPTEVNV